MANMTTNGKTPGTIQLGWGLAGKVHYENPSQEGGDAATLCGRGADRIRSSAGSSADCKACVKAWGKIVAAAADQVVVDRALARNARQAARSRRGEEIHAAHRAGEAYPAAAAAIQVCPCGMMSGDSHHKRHCPTRPDADTVVEWPTVGNAPRARTMAPVRVPGTEAQRRAIRTVSWAQDAGTSAVIHGATKRTLARDAWITVGAATGVITLTDGARAWLASEHVAEVTPHMLESGVTVYAATCNCGYGHENPRLARRLPWNTGFHLTAEDAIAVALGHGAVSRPQYHADAVTDAPKITDSAETPDVDRITVDADTADRPWDDALISGMESVLGALRPTGDDSVTVPDVTVRVMLAAGAITRHEVSEMMSPEEAVKLLHTRERRWSRRRKPSGSRNAPKRPVRA